MDNKSFQVRNVKIARNELKETSLQCDGSSGDGQCVQSEVSGFLRRILVNIGEYQ